MHLGAILGQRTGRVSDAQNTTPEAIDEEADEIERMMTIMTMSRGVQEADLKDLMRRFLGNVRKIEQHSLQNDSRSQWGLIRTFESNFKERT